MLQAQRAMMAVVAFLLISMTLSLASAESNTRTTVEANVVAPIVRIDVPDYLFFGNVTPGYVSERLKIVVNNTGTTNVKVIPQFEQGADEVFSHLIVAHRVREDFVPLEQFTMTIPKPRAVGKSEDDYFYAKLDLKSYNGKVAQDRRARAVILFVAVPA